jgi:predicted transcriptional regulator
MIFSDMKTLEQLEAEIRKLPPSEQERLRDWLEKLLEGRFELKEDFKAEIEAGKKNIAEGRYRVPKVVMKTATIKFPGQLAEQLQKLVEAGWFKSPEEGVVEALRRYLSGHSIELQEKQILADVEWGLHGRD